MNEFTSDEKQFKRTNKTDEWNDDSDAESEEDDQDQEEKEDDEGEDTERVKTYIKSIIPFLDDNDDERNPLCTSSPKGNITIMLYISVHVSNNEI